MTTNEIIRVLKDENADTETRNTAMREALASLNADGRARILAYVKALLAEQNAENSRIPH